MPWKTFQEQITLHAQYFSKNCSNFIIDDLRFNYCNDNTRSGKEKCCQETVDFYYPNNKPNICNHLKNNSSMLLSCEFSSVNREFGIRVCVILSILMVLVLITYSNTKNKNPYYRNPEDVKKEPKEKEKLIVNSAERDRYNTV